MGKQLYTRQTTLKLLVSNPMPLSEGITGHCEERQRRSNLRKTRIALPRSQ